MKITKIEIDFLEKKGELTFDNYEEVKKTFFDELGKQIDTLFFSHLEQTEKGLITRKMREGKITFVSIYKPI